MVAVRLTSILSVSNSVRMLISFESSMYASESDLNDITEINIQLEIFAFLPDAEHGIKGWIW